jgi:hypothetical protein
MKELFFSFFFQRNKIVFFIKTINIFHMKKISKKRAPKKKFLFIQNSEFLSFTDSQIDSAPPDVIYKLIIGTYYGLHSQLCSDAVTKTTKVLDGQPVVDYLQSTIEKVENLYPGILSEIRKQNSNFVIQC